MQGVNIRRVADHSSDRRCCHRRRRLLGVAAASAVEGRRTATAVHDMCHLVQRRWLQHLTERRKLRTTGWGIRGWPSLAGTWSGIWRRTPILHFPLNVRNLTLRTTYSTSLILYIQYVSNFTEFKIFRKHVSAVREYS